MLPTEKADWLKYFAHIFTGFPSAVLAIDQRGLIIYGNEQAAQLLKSTPEQLIKRTWPGIDAHLNIIEWDKIRRALTPGIVSPYETDVITVTGRLNPVSVALLGLTPDCTLVIIEDSLKRDTAKNLLDLITTNQEIGSWSYNTLTEEWFISETCYILSGIPPLDQLIVSTGELRSITQKYLNTEDQQKLWLLIKHIIKTGEPFEHTLAFDNQQGSINYITVSAIARRNALETSQILGTVTVNSALSGVDINGGLALFSLDHATSMIYWLRPNGTFAYTNEAFRQKLGYLKEDFKSICISQITHNYTEETFEQWWDDLRQHKHSNGTAELIDKSGEIIVVRFKADIIFTNDLELATIHCTDIRLEQQKNRQLELTQFSTDTSNELIFWTAPQGYATYVNKAVCELTGYTKAELLRLHMSDFCPEFTDEARAVFWQTLRENGSLQNEYEVRSKDGQVITLSALVNYHQSPDGQELAFSFCRNITERRTNQRRADLSQFTLDHVLEMIMWARPDGIVHYVNDTFLELTGYRREEIENNSILKLYPGSSEEGRLAIWDRLRNEKIVETDAPLVLADGTKLPVVATLNYIVFEGEEYDCIFMRNNTKKLERDNQLSLAKLALEAATECIIWIEDDGIVRYINPAMLILVGGEANDWVSKPVTHIFPTLDLEAFPQEDKIEIEFKSFTDKIHHLELVFSTIETDEKLLTAIVGRDFTERFLKDKELLEALQKIDELSKRLQQENVVLKEDISTVYNFNNIITVSPNYRQVLQKIGQVAQTNATVLILGETGTGKELLARATHSLSDREELPLVKVNCATLPENLIESELFGHEKGAFTGASDRKIGRFEMAHQGTLFLDEVGELPLSSQVKLLRVLQEGEFERVGGTATISVDVRLIAATNRNLKEMVSKGAFREDLYYRLNVFPILNLPLRERKEDIPELIEFFVRKYSKQQGKVIQEINKADIDRLSNYHFPGNVRELENIVERAVVLCNGSILNIELNVGENPITPHEVSFNFEEIQRAHIIKALKYCDGRVTGPQGAGQLLGLNDRTLMSKMRKLNIDKKDYLL
jgi:PAS domain S-box-containing protein